MVDSLTEARAELHDVTGKQLGNLVAQLEKTVSVIPNDASSSSAAREDGEVSDAEDPTEMFHRDVGTQTSFIDSTSPSTRDTEPSSQKQVDTLNALTKSLCVLRDQLRGQGEGFEDIRVLLDVLRDDLDGLTYGGNEPISVHDGYPHSGKNEPEDEIRKVRDNIRRVKGSLLSSRSFPGSMR